MMATESVVYMTRLPVLQWGARERRNRPIGLHNNSTRHPAPLPRFAVVHRHPNCVCFCYIQCNIKKEPSPLKLILQEILFRLNHNLTKYNIYYIYH